MTTPQARTPGPGAAEAKPSEGDKPEEPNGRTELERVSGPGKPDSAASSAASSKPSATREGGEGGDGDEGEESGQRFQARDRDDEPIGKRGGDHDIVAEVPRLRVDELLLEVQADLGIQHVKLDAKALELELYAQADLENVVKLVDHAADRTPKIVEAIAHHDRPTLPARVARIFGDSDSGDGDGDGDGGGGEEAGEREQGDDSGQRRPQGRAGSDGDDEREQGRGGAGSPGGPGTGARAARTAGT
ncbi:MAG TPA: hypothetical protein VK279_03830, partial [Solirubrobacteraceae bacterium]|nr:hypothetical protein [Solirubrobacteraceae bacterium]